MNIMDGITDMDIESNSFENISGRKRLIRDYESNYETENKKSCIIKQNEIIKLSKLEQISVNLQQNKVPIPPPLPKNTKNNRPKRLDIFYIS